MKRVAIPAPVLWCARFANKLSLNQRHAETTNAGKFQGGAPDIEPEHAAEKIQLDAFNPADRQTEITTDRNKRAGARRRQTIPVAAIGVVLANRRWWQHRLQLGHGVEDGLDKGIRVRAGPWNVVAIGLEL